MAMDERRGRGVAAPGDARSPWGIDYSRVVHSSSFRRLQGKTQILSVGDGDFHRTRLTHSLETAQIAEGIVERLATGADGTPHLPPNQLARTVALCHDLGHPPFGHSGEVALDRCMAGHGGFEGNGQTLRIVASLEHYSDGYGADLTRRAMLGILKYPVSQSAALRARGARPSDGAKPPKCFLDTENHVVEWLLADFSAADTARFTSLTESLHGPRTSNRTLDCSIMEIADDVAYGVHDLEDAVALRLISRDRFDAAIGTAALQPFFDWMIEKGSWTDARHDYFMADLFGEERPRKRAVGRLVYYFIASAALTRLNEFEHPLLRHRAILREDARRLLDELQRLVAREVILRPSVQQLEFKGRRVVEAVFGAYRSDPFRLLPDESRRAYEATDDPLRAICDHVASLTDQGIVRIYERLFVTRSGSPFDLL